ncbi:MAG: HDOD domain-containing protein [Deltaproteobacteria bacterium]|nr:HDOD domain-containing protein [Deltaproteobacteria bacterium]
MKLKKLERIVTHIEDLPTLPTTVLKITELINNPKSSARDIADIVTDDQVLTARLLKLVNSSFYGFPQKISTVTGAIVLLGFDAIRDLLLTTSIFDVFLTKNKAIKNDLERLWKHSLGCAVAAKVIGSYTKHDKLEELFVAGLLHDIGKVVEALFFPDDFSRISSLVTQKRIRIVQAEEEILGFTHADTGKLLAEQWNLPPKLVSVIANHHTAEKLTGRFIQEISIVHISDIICRALDLGSGGDNMIPPLNEQAWDILSLDTDLIYEIMEKVDREFKDLSLFV